MRALKKISDLGFWQYALGGVWRRLGNAPACPCCGSGAGVVVDRKWFHSLIECAGCGILHRYPTERDREMAEFYQQAYDEPGFASEMPDEATLQQLLATNFKGTPKDFSGQIAILKALGLRPGDRLMDFGASWGYATYQFRQAGFAAEGFELSKPRAAYGRRLGLDIAVQPPAHGPLFDMVYSCHVLEHVPNPLQTLNQMLAWVRPGGMVVAQTPNGSRDFRAASPAAFHRLWGRVHPFLLTAEFVKRNFGHLPGYVSCDDRPASVSAWDRQSCRVADTGGSNLFLAIHKNQ
ncbi:MAG: class I SAM-dependent methyltransferase [Acidobacteria bacterium]|nr:class I SAM-dependent methyltransferase [Acidobacteriota bacterium]